jgi:hypothetical protein
LPEDTNWICVDTSNPWDNLSEALTRPPQCSPSSCAITCATGRACNNTWGGPDADLDKIIDTCDPNDNSNTDGCMDDATDCARVDLRVTADAGDFFQVYIDGRLANLSGLCPVTGCLTARIDTLSRGLHNLRIVYISGTSSGNYNVTYNLDGTVDFGLDSSPVIPAPSPSMAAIGDERSINFTVR